RTVRRRYFGQAIFSVIFIAVTYAVICFFVIIFRQYLLYEIAVFIVEPAFYAAVGIFYFYLVVVFIIDVFNNMRKITDF
ncbi:hypothetical protein, partial [Megamonas funiformis]|uniref:hypothetical protein n=1 Tax=Megamonas funiformis TaxID=437897 RepID=UPI0022E8305C